MNLNDIREPFAAQGDLGDLPYDIREDGLISWLQGYSFRYGNTPEEDGVYIERLVFNRIINLLSGFMLQLKENAATIQDLNNKLDTAIYKRDKANFVTTNTNQTITSLKTFNTAPRCGNNPVNANDLVRLGYLQTNPIFNGGLGVGQNYVNVLSQRQANTLYYNNTSKPIMVYIVARDRSGRHPLRVYVNNVVIINLVDYGNEYERDIFSFLVPAGANYKIDTANYLESWIELR